MSRTVKERLERKNNDVTKRTVVKVSEKKGAKIREKKKSKYLRTLFILKSLYRNKRQYFEVKVSNV